MFAGLQYRLWVADGGLAHTHRLANDARALGEQNARLAARNAALDAEIADLKSGVAAIESRARITLGMVRDGETFFLVVDPT
ncbi:MAG: septum formation initiator family protein [Gammaproteobacteria bacterium]